MTWSAVPSGQACGVRIEGLDLAHPLDEETVARLRGLWLEHHVLVFPGKCLEPSDLERITLCFGRFSDDPFIAPIADHKHVIAVERRPDETGAIFAEAWHSDWSFMATPPAGTLLYGIVIPPQGGDTLFANQHRAWSAMPDPEKSRYRAAVAVHSARRAYAPEGFYGENDPQRSMSIRASQSAHALQRHPLVRHHPESGLEGFFGCAGYIVDVEGLTGPPEDELESLLAWQTRDDFVYRHRWEQGMLVMWDNRSVLHKATGGYEGHHRLLHRTTIGADLA